MQAQKKIRNGPKERSNPKNHSAKSEREKKKGSKKGGRGIPRELALEHHPSTGTPILERTGGAKGGGRLCQPSAKKNVRLKEIKKTFLKKGKKNIPKKKHKA